MGLLLTLLASVAKRRNSVEFLNCTVATLHVPKDEIGPPFVTRTRRIRLIPYDQIVSWGYGDIVFGAEFDIISSMTKARRYGFHEAVDAEELLRMFDGLRASKVIP